MCSTSMSGRVQLLLGQSQVLPRNRLLCCPVLKSSSATASFNKKQPTHQTLRSSPIPAPGRRHVAAAPSALPTAAATAATAAFSPWNTLAVLCSCAAAAQVAEDNTSWGKLLSAPLLTLLLALGAAALGLLPPTSPVYDIVWSHLMPLAIALFLLDHDVSNIRTVGGPVLASFLLGAGTMLAGAAAAWLMCKSSMAAAAGSTAAAAKLAACLVASYIGGSVNFIAVAAATQLPTSLVPGAMAADNLGMLLALGLLMAVPLRFLQQQRQQQRQLAYAGAPAPPTGSSSSSSSGGSSGSSRPRQQPRRSVAPPAVAAAARGPGSVPGPAQPEGTGPRALDGSPLLTEPPSQYEVAACLEETSHGDNHTRMLPVLPPKPKEGIVAPLIYSSSSSSSSGGGSGSGSSSDEDWGTEWQALDGSPLLTEPPSQAEVAACLEETSHGDNHTRMLPVLPRVSNSNSSSSSNGGKGSAGSSSDEDWVEWVALDGSPLLTEPPTPLEIATALDEIRHGDNHTRVLPINVSGKRSSGNSSSSGSSSDDDGRVALDGSPLLTEPPSQGEVVVALEEISHGDNHTRVLPVLPKLKSSSSGSSGNGSVLASPTAAATAAAEGLVVGKCGGCPGSGVTARDDNPLLTRVPSMGDGIATINSAKQGEVQIRTPPKPPSASSFTSKFNRTAATAVSGSNGSSSSSSSSRGYNSQRGSDGLIVGCGGCSEALDAIAAASPLSAAVAAGGWSGSSGTAVLAADSSSGSGALALDGSMLLTEPDTSRLAAAVAAARKGGSNGSSVAVSPVVSGEFELLVKLDKDSLMQRLRRQQRKHKKQQQKQQTGTAPAAAGAAASSGSYDSGSDSSSSSSSSDDEDLLALDGSQLLTQLPSQDEVAVFVEGASQGDNQTRVLPVLPKVSSSSSSSSKGVTSDSDSSWSQEAAPAPAAPGVAAAVSSSSSGGALTAGTAAAAVAAAAVAAAAARELATLVGTPALHQLFLAAIALGISVAAAAVGKLHEPSAAGPAAAVGGPGPFAGASQLGQVLIGVFFAALGASCCCPLSTLACCLPLLAFVTVMTVTHWALLWGLGGRVLGLQPEVLLCGSAAAIGGPATAAGLATAKGWGQLVQPSLLCGSLGYALGTGAGLLVAQGLGVLA